MRESLYCCQEVHPTGDRFSTGNVTGVWVHEVGIVETMEKITADLQFLDELRQSCSCDIGIAVVSLVAVGVVVHCLFQSPRNADIVYYQTTLFIFVNPIDTCNCLHEIAREKRIPASLVMQNYMMERLLERISVSVYRDFFIVKGGFLIAAMVGLNTRATMDMDATLKGMPVSEETLKRMFDDICEIDLKDDIQFIFKGMSEIREGDDYMGYRISLLASYPPMSVPLKLDLTVGDKVTPKEITYHFLTLFDNREISVLAYNLETLLAEKLETVISRGDQNTRTRDYYDIYILSKLHDQNLDIGCLRTALKATAEKRGSFQILQNYKNIIEIVQNSQPMLKQWETYQKDFD